jgi:hypothetical protein
MWDLTSFYISMFGPDLTNTQQPNIQQPKISTSTKEKERESDTVRDRREPGFVCV